MKSLDVVTFGEAMAMFVAEETGELHEVSRFTRRMAGAEVNVAIGLARLGLRSGWTSRVGDDPFGRYLVAALRAEGVDVSRVGVDAEHPTGFMLKARVLEGDPQIHYFRRGSAASRMGAAELDSAYLAGARHLHMTGIPPAISPSMREFAASALRTVRESGGTVSFDPNLRPSLWKRREEMVETINAFAAQADVVLPGVAEGEILAGTSDPRGIADFFLRGQAGLVVVKLGARGAYYRSRDAEGTVPGYRVEEVVDTVGAGDGFAVGLVSALLEGLPVEEAVRRGNAIGALAVMSPGDNEGYPTRPELDLFIQRGRAE
jgi:2-dehydro-3-deoxygluconokinase